ncbi:hypothetical protein ACKC9G_01850 [Pokkaliibacter sp. CJK22405]|uniref:hypothetical protein n=1 Tax=Pokkaliibacter sp. CJK22405 TaxID=3384615 RepID=UPI003984A85A
MPEAREVLKVTAHIKALQPCAGAESAYSLRLQRWLVLLSEAVLPLSQALSAWLMLY